MRKATVFRPPTEVGFRFGPVLALTGLISLLVVVALRSPARATPDHLNAFNQKYETSGSRLDGCTTCHTSTPDADHLNNYGLDFRDADHDFATIEQLDSDGDGSTNIDEINARTFPGDPDDRPAPPAPQEPAPTSSTVPPTTSEPAPAPTPDVDPDQRDTEPPPSSEPTSAGPAGLARTGIGVFPLVSVAVFFLALGPLVVSAGRRARR